ncbi:MAG: metallophosphoesterase [Prevotellaceae bacterium]|jgi:hypothetical protein|nr:metallophosphoesterase [Prevotellaceae bacterium]
MKSIKPTRRRFLNMLAFSGAGLIAIPRLSASGLVDGSPQQGQDRQSPVDSLPTLQCPSETEITVVWAVRRPATGFVEFGAEKDRLDRTAYGDVFGLKPYHSRFLQVRIEGLKPNTRYYYRTVTRPFTYKDAYSFEQGELEYSNIFSFETSGRKKTASSFSVINDTHNNQKTLELLSKRLNQIGSDYTVWNGDLDSSYSDADHAVEAVLRPAGTFASEHPLLFVPGNHDYRGEWARNISLLLPTWNHKNSEDRLMGRNFAVRTGPLALIGLDTGEDKPDRHPAWAGLANFEPYRVEQRNWLERTLNSPEIKSAPFAVAFCHIPLFSSNPDDNGGDSLEGYADFQRQAGELWGPLLSKHKVQATIVAHTHQFKYDPADGNRSWAQIAGGGHQKVSTVIHGKVDGNKLEIVADDVFSNKELGRWQFAKRK